MARSGANVIDLATHPKLTHLLGQIEEMSAGSSMDTPALPGRPSKERAVAELYLEIGRYVHWLSRQDPAAVNRIQDEARQWAAEADKRLGAPSVVIPRLDPPAAALPSGRGRRPSTDPAPEPAADLARERAPTPPAVVSPPSVRAAVRGVAATERVVPVAFDPDASLVEIEPEPLEAGAAAGRAPAMGNEELPILDYDGELLIEPLEAEAAEEPTDSAVQPVVAGEGAWVRDLQDLLAGMGPPEGDDLDVGACVAAASRLLNATTQMEVRWMGFPDAVQHGLLGMISCRARALQAQMEVDVELRMTLGRLRRFHSARGLQAVPALRDDSVPMAGSWSSDAQQWWDNLTA
jgi:hypothetical protein